MGHIAAANLPDLICHFTGSQRSRLNGVRMPKISQGSAGRHGDHAIDPRFQSTRHDYRVDHDIGSITPLPSASRRNRP